MKIIEVKLINPIDGIAQGKKVDFVCFYSLAKAKKFIKENISNYKSSVIYKIYANGDEVNLGSVELGNNRKYVANSRQKSKSYV